MTSVGALISTPSGLRTVVKVVPGRVDSSLSNVVTEPLSGYSQGVPGRPGNAATPLPGQAESAAAFVQTLTMPSDTAASPDTSDSGTSSTDTSQGVSSQAQSQAPTAPSGTPANAAAATSGEATSGEDLPVQTIAADSTLPPSQIFSQAASAYQIAQQRGPAAAQEALLVG